MALRKQEQLYFVERMLVLLDAGLPLLESINAHASIGFACMAKNNGIHCASLTAR
jgi:hypothetical protein